MKLHKVNRSDSNLLFEFDDWQDFIDQFQELINKNEPLLGYKLLMDENSLLKLKSQVKKSIPDVLKLAPYSEYKQCFKVNPEVLVWDSGLTLFGVDIYETDVTYFNCDDIYLVYDDVSTITDDDLKAIKIISGAYNPNQAQGMQALNPWIEQAKINSPDDVVDFKWLIEKLKEKPMEKETEKEIELVIGTRATLETFIQTYTTVYLRNHGIRIMKLAGLASINLYSADTKYGEMIIHKEDIITYVGKNVWSVTKHGDNDKE